MTKKSKQLTKKKRVEKKISTGTKTARKKELMARKRIMRQKRIARKKEQAARKKALRQKRAVRKKEWLAKKRALRQKRIARKKEQAARKKALRQKRAVRKKEWLAKKRALRQKRVARKKEMAARKRALRHKRVARKQENAARKKAARNEKVAWEKRKANQDKKPIVLKYDLYSLPTAQHKAGLAGLLLMIDSMKERGLKPLPEIMERTATGACISFTRKSMQTIFDDLYDASWVEIESKSKWSGTKPKRVIEKIIREKEKTRKEKRYIYDGVQPALKYLNNYYPDGSEAWLKLWRDMIWNTLRGRPTTRNVYEERANKKKSTEAEKVWKEFVKAREFREKGQSPTQSIASSICIGAQSVNAEGVPFQGTTENNFLLNFWLNAALVFAPQEITTKGDYEYAGYVLAIPEPANPTSFIDDLKKFLGRLDVDIAGYRPKAAIIDIPAEGGLEYLYHLTRFHINQQEIKYTVNAVEIYYLEKQGNNIRTLTAERIIPDINVLGKYELLRKECHNSFYKKQRIMNLLAGEPWHHGMDSVFNHQPWEYFIRKAGKTPARIPFFGNDVRHTFDGIIGNGKYIKKGGKESMSTEDQEKQLAERVYKLIQNYVRRKTESKSNVKYDDFKNNKDQKGKVNYPQEYLDAKERICSEAFLAMRGRRERDFIEYFTGTICSVSQWLPEEEYLAVSQALLADWEKVKTLSMLALSANS